MSDNEVSRSDKVLVQVYMERKLRDYIKEAARSEDRTLSSFIRIRMTMIAEKVLGRKLA